MIERSACSDCPPNRSLPILSPIREAIFYRAATVYRAQERPQAATEPGANLNTHQESCSIV
jgi:hypothetical protein